ncbi:MAG: hypothetical protein KBG15_08285 [Kofleriaceae bacterium]|nr:hypothetical protein [Kofleriaceae bacterium]
MAKRRLGGMLKSPRWWAGAARPFRSVAPSLGLSPGPLAIALLLSGGVSACRRNNGVPDKKLGGLVVAPVLAEKPISLDAAAKSSAELLRVVSQPLTAGKGALPSHRVVMTNSNIVEEASKLIEKLDEQTAIEVADAGRWHATYTNSGDNGREAIFDGNELFLRPRYMGWHGRPPNDVDEPAQMLASYDHVIAANWELLMPGAELTDQGVVQFAGRAARKLTVKLAPTSQPAGKETLPQRAWRTTRKVTAVDGEFVFDAETTRLLAAKLNGAIEFSRDGRQFVMRISSTRTVEGVGTAIAVAAPPATEVVATPERMREADERDALLDGIAPPSRRPTAPAVSGDPPVPALPIAPKSKDQPQGKSPL